MASSSKRRRVLPWEQPVLEQDRQIRELQRKVEERHRQVEEWQRQVEERHRQIGQSKSILAEMQQSLWEEEKQLKKGRYGDPVLERSVVESRERIEQQMSFIAKQEKEAAELEVKAAEFEVKAAKFEVKAEEQIQSFKAEIARIELADTSTGDDYYDLITNLGAPSSLTNAKNWRRAQEQLLFLCHIPPEAEPPFPLTLVHRAFANFVDRFHSSRIEFGNQECELVTELCIVAAKDVKDEKQKMEEFNQLIGDYLGEAINQVVVASSCTTDGSLLVKKYTAYLSEVKKDEVNTLFQAMQYYALFLSKMTRDETKRTFCPCFLVELVGVCIRISGLAFFSKVACQPLTPFMHCYINSYDTADMDSLCRAMLALKKGVSELREYYNAHPNPPPTVDKRIPYPLQEQQMQYVKRIGAQKLLFVVEMEPSGERRLCKFCKRYGKGVHETWAQAGLAPKLFKCGEIPGGWIAVEMEYLSPDDWKSVHQWCNNQLPEIDQSRLWSAVNSALQRAFNLECEMEYLSADDWKSVQQLCSSVSKRDESALLLAVENAVKSVLKLKHEVAHGDMRPPNVMARAVEGGFEIKFVDFACPCEWFFLLEVIFLTGMRSFLGLSIMNEHVVYFSLSVYGHPRHCSSDNMIE
ncbi:hypothetical protein GOP47_0009128 [Adiantum capillus-veneris]|uniref:Protein kinase domain-containing protein n=1 Tax=Adiantum capillus-veneris TaxID=13818 RepID=A0A9D4ZIN9_ADICA|nr:hypothetical protein GOP47_0009128 [Adiantum capillus-veneris]